MSIIIIILNPDSKYYNLYPNFFFFDVMYNVTKFNTIKTYSARI